jgi:hypothetical protein
MSESNFDPVLFGQAVAKSIREAVDPLLRRIEQLEASRPEKGQDGKDGQDGKSVTVEDVAPMIERAVLKAVEALPKAKDGEPGRDGKDAEPVNVEALEDAVVKRLLAADRLDTLADLKAAEAVERHFEEHPVRDGRDGEDASPEQIASAVKAYLTENPPPKGEPGKDGRDGLDVKDMLRNHEGRLIAVMSDGTTRDLGEFVGKDGAPGKDGRDGADFSGVEFDYDGERTLTIRGKGGEIVKRLPIPMDKGYYRDGAYEKGDVTTHDGIAWIALRDTKAKPSISAKEDWRIFARKGRDGRDGRDGIDKTAPVALGSK